MPMVVLIPEFEMVFYDGSKEKIVRLSFLWGWLNFIKVPVHVRIKEEDQAMIMEGILTLQRKYQLFH